MAADTELRVAITMTNARQLRTVTNELEKMGGTQRGFRQVDKTAQQAGRSVEDIGKFAKFTLSVLEAFLLYKGFVFLKTQAQEFTRELVELEHQVAIIQTQLGDVPGDFQSQIRAGILDVSGRTGASLETLADAQFSIVSANIELSRSFQVLDAVTKAAVAGGLQDVNTAVESVLTQMNAFGLEAEDTTQILDKQFNLVRRGIFTYEQFARVSGMVSVAFAGIGQDLETANAALATVSQIFTGPQLRFGATALRNLASSVGENAEEFESLGVAVFDKEGDFRNFVDIMRDLQVQLEGLSEQQRFEALRQIFPDEREIRGALAILGRLDTLEQFFIEQQFAVGDLDKAYETVNESLKTQAQIFRNDLVPAAEPALLFFSDFLGVVNTLNEQVPGFTRNILQLATAFAALKVAQIASTQAGFAGLSQRRFGPFPATAAGRASSLFSRTPTGLGLVAAGLGAGLAFETGRRPEEGLDVPGLVGGISGGALAGGMLGGPGGAAIGGAVGGALVLFGELFEKEADTTAKAWNERFREAVLEEGAETGKALVQSLLPEGDEAPTPTAQDLVRDIARGPLELQGTRLTSTGPTQAARTIAPVRRVEAEVTADLRDLIRNVVSSARDATEEAFTEERIRLREALGIQTPGRETVLRQTADVEFERRMDDVIAQFGKFGELAPETEKVIEQARNLVSIFINMGATTEQIETAFTDVAAEGGTLADVMNAVQTSIESELPRFLGTISDFTNRVSFSASEITGMFDELALSTTSLGEDFLQLQRTLQAFEFIETLQAGGLINQDQAGLLATRVALASGFGVEGEGVPTTLSNEQLQQVSNQLMASVRGQLEEKTQSALEVFGLATVSIADVMESAAANIEDGLAPAISMGTNELTGFAQSFREFNQRIQAIQLIEELTALSSALNLTDDQMANLNEAIVILAERALSTADTGFLEASPEDLADFFLSLIESSQAQKPDQPDTLDLPGRSQLQEAFINTADAFDRGIIQSANFTSQQLREMGSDIAIFNKQIRKIQLIEEIGRVAEIAGVGIDLTGTIQNLIQRLTIGGETLATLIEDPERLADLIATAEFREVNLDQSDRRSFVIRVSTDADPSRAAELADSIMREINNATQEALAP